MFFDLKILSGFRLVLPKFRPVTRSMCYAFWEMDSLYTCPGVPFLIRLVCVNDFFGDCILCWDVASNFLSEA